MSTSVPQAFTVAMPILILFVIIPMARTTVFVLMDFIRMEQTVKVQFMLILSISRNTYQ